MLEVGEVLSKNHIDIVGSQERWKLDDSKIYVSGYGLVNLVKATKVVRRRSDRFFGM